MGLQDRLRKLESRSESRRCVECGLPPDGPGFIVISDEGRRREQEWCAKCGRPLYCIIEVVYEDEVRGPGEEVLSWP